MSVAKIVEISAESSASFEDAIRQGIQRASKTIQNIKSAWVSEQKVDVENGKIVGYRVHLKVTFVLEE
jgi:flavin-binding protein dodecin